MPKTAPFEHHADAYDQWFDDHQDLYEAELNVIRLLLPPAGGKSLEVGVGSGKFAGPLGIEVGIDPSLKMCARARNRGIPVYAGVAEALPFREDCFDLVLMVTTICFVDDLARSFAEAWRVLKAGGALLLGFVDKDSELGRLYAANRDKSRFYRAAVFYSSKEVLNSLKKSGFGPVTVRKALIPGLSPGAVCDASGNGAFVVVRGAKPLAVRS